MTGGFVHSIQTLGALDGPGLRFVVFLQGCNLRCGCCHNPDTWDVSCGTEYTADEIVSKALRYKNYFGDKGGITLSGGEPLIQPEFAKEIFAKCRQEKINTCLDTSGSILNGEIKELLEYTDRVLLDVKYHSDSLYREHVGCSIDMPLKFLAYLNKKNIPTTLRQVIIPGLNDTDENIDFINTLIDSHQCVYGVELLPFKKMCQVKYDSLGMKFKFASFDEPSKALMENLNKKVGTTR